jgi:hypothetical protein
MRAAHSLAATFEHSTDSGHLQFIVVVFRFPILVAISTTKCDFFAANSVNLLSDNENIVK